MTSEGYFDQDAHPASSSSFSISSITSSAGSRASPGISFRRSSSSILFFRGRRGAGREQWLVFAALTAEILIYIVLMPTNYGGGGGSLANRYFLNIFPLFFFLPRAQARGRAHLALAWIFAAVFIAQILVTPFQSSANPATHAKRFPIKALPLEMTLYNEFPTNTNPDGFRVPFGARPNDGVAYFLNDNFHKRAEAGGTWTRGDRTLEMVLKTQYPGERDRLSPDEQPPSGQPDHGPGRRPEADARPPAARERRRSSSRSERDSRSNRITCTGSRSEPPRAPCPISRKRRAPERRDLGVFFEIEFVPAGGDR